MMRGYSFTERVRRILARAREEAERLHHEYVGTEHVLLALAREREGTAIDVLRGLGADPQALGQRVEQIVRPGAVSAATGRDLPYTSRAKKALEHSMNAVRMLQHGGVGSEHLLLGLLAEAQGIAAQVLGEAGVTLEGARAELVRILGTPTGAPTHHAGLGDDTAEPLERVEVILHYSDGRRFEGSFDTASDALGFLRSAARPHPG
jgi:ATP-dependent Clp protease ATP-binding subunit ClpC